MKRLIRTVAALLSAAMLCGCSGNTAPKPRLDVDTTPVVGENCVTPPFWVVEDDSTGAQIFLLGSMHAGIKGTEYPDYVLEALRNSSWAAPEMDTVDFSRDFVLQQKCAQYLLLNGTTMQDILGEDYDSTEDYFRSKGIYQLGMDGMIPFYWASAASGLVIDEAGLDSSCGTESVLLELAHSEKIEIREIEGGEAQYKMMGEIPMSVQVQSLAECVGDDKISAQAEASLELYNAWSCFDEEYLDSLEVYDPAEVDSPEDWQKYYDLMYTDRQKLMADFIIDSLKCGEQGFVFVGAMHYFAEPSILTQLTDAGYTVTAIRGTVADDGIQAA